LQIYELVGGTQEPRRASAEGTVPMGI